jgi:hypothetical protein
MSDRSNEYGYIQDGPTQSSSSNSGVFLVNDVVDLLNQNKYALQAFSVSYLVLAGAGGGSTASSSNNRPGGGGGAGGYRNSFASETSGGNSSTESTHTTIPGTSYTVTVGAGGAGANGGYLLDGDPGSNSVFSTITSLGGGGCQANSDGREDGGSGAGGFHNTAGSPGEGTTGQGHDGGAGNNSSSMSGGSGGGAGGVGQAGIHFQTGSVSVGAGLSSSITGSAVTRALGGGQGQQGNTGTSGSANTGTGGRGTGGTSNAGTGGSGVVILRYPNTFTITVGSGLTSSTATDGDDKVTTFTVGTDTVSFA